jgi:hypothetical protein
VNEEDEIMKTIKILRNETFKSYKEKKLHLHEKYIKKLKILTILTLFNGCPSFNIIKLSAELEMKIEDACSLLIEASINKLISIEIDE